MSIPQSKDHREQWGNPLIHLLIKELYQREYIHTQSICSWEKRGFKTYLSIKLASAPWTLARLLEKTFQTHMSVCRGICPLRGQWKNCVSSWASTTVVPFQHSSPGWLQCLRGCLTSRSGPSIRSGAVRSTPLRGDGCKSALRNWL